ncbi:hypothetical protein EVAR_49465_1 [Eumeta japonica]|uniref:Uncharacterized protein n=1 Tax=Eumeta variegata TaxID=151549 RepID=A0A4C1Y635_EUMVA|nr:hypothetical protein EVAR_49465_1 [Eumeta japonica]
MYFKRRNLSSRGQQGPQRSRDLRSRRQRIFRHDAIERVNAERTFTRLSHRNVHRNRHVAVGSGKVS